MADRYFAALPTEEVGKAIYEKIEQFYNQVETLGYFSKVAKSHTYYYGSSDWQTSTGKLFTSSRIMRQGDQGQEFTFKINSFRNIIQHLLVMTTAERPEMEAQAVNTDSESLSQADLGDGLLDHYMTNERLEKLFVQCCEFALVYGAGHIEPIWDTDKGKQYGVNSEGQMIYDGDMAFFLHTPLDVILDIYRSSTEHSWKCVRKYKNKYDLAATHPDKAEDILNSTTKDKNYNKFSFSFRSMNTSSDDIAVYRFYHDATPAIPDGRLVEIIDGGTVLFDGPLPYDKVPVYSMYSARIADMPFGYTIAFDLLALQEASDTLNSSILTNNCAFGTQLIGLPKGHDLNYRDLSKGLAVIEFDPVVGPPIPIQLTQTSSETYKYAEMIDIMMEKISGLNSIVRGQPQGQLTGASGAAMALLASTAQQFNQGLQREYEHLVEDVGTAIIKTLQRYAETPRIASIAGISKRSQLKEFKGGDLAQVDRVRVARKSAISRTTAGKLEIAKDLLQQGMVSNPEQYAEAIKTGTIEPMFESGITRAQLIRKENEKMRNGEVPIVLRTDNHQLHHQEHLTLLDDPDVRYNPTITEAVLAHLQEHEMYLQPPMPPMGPDGMPMEGGPTPDAAQALDPNIGPPMPNMPDIPNLPKGAPEELQSSYEQLNPQAGLPPTNLGV